MIQCPNCHQEMDSYTEHSQNGITKVIVCTCGYISRKILCDVMENNPLDIQVNTYSSIGVGAAKKNKKTKHENKRGIHEKK